jgi:hypothetical protein
MTERRAMQEQLHQSQKMEAIGQLVNEHGEVQYEAKVEAEVERIELKQIAGRPSRLLNREIDRPCRPALDRELREVGSPAHLLLLSM